MKKNNFQLLIKNEPIKVIFTLIHFFGVFIVFMNMFKKINYFFYVIVSIWSVFIIIYAIYVKINQNYEKTSTSITLFKHKFVVINGNLIYKIVLISVWNLTFIIYSSNQYRKEKFDLISIIIFFILSIILIMFIKISKISTR
jgi:hypothetical protein